MLFPLTTPLLREGVSNGELGGVLEVGRKCIKIIVADQVANPLQKICPFETLECEHICNIGPGRCN